MNEILRVGAVITTGIYCRDGCPASPNPGNVRRFQSGVAAEAAGFRACLRCRPDRMPGASAASADDELVGRTLLLIADGALDSATEETLAARLGVSARHLRRVFAAEIGATPGFVARSRRAHFARRLLDESDLSIEGISLAAGFSSVRQMNRVMLDTFRFTPSELRAKRRDADRLVADGGLVLRVPYTGALSFQDMLTYLGARAIPGVERVVGGTYRRTLTSCGHPGAIEVSDPGDQRHLLMRAHLPTFGSIIDDVARVRRIFGLDQPQASTTHLASDDAIGPLITARPGLRAPGAWDPFEVAVRIIIGQHVSVRAATSVTGTLVQAFGAPVRGLGKLDLSRVFPPAARIAEASTSRIAATGMPLARAEAVRALARAYVDESVRLDGSRSLDQLVEELTALPGVGPWTAQMIALRAASHADAFPAGDLGLRRAAARILRPDDSRALGERELSDAAEAWKPYRALAAMHLWMSAVSG